MTDMPKKSHLIVSEKDEPTVAIKSGMRFEARSISIVDEQFVASHKVAARLCGGTSTCLALVEI